MSNVTVRCCLALALLAGCSGSTEPSIGDDTPPPPGVFTTDAISYLAVPDGASSELRRFRLTVITRYTNPTSQTIYLATCFPGNRTPIYGVQLIAPTDAWGAAWNPVLACVGHDEQLFVLPGATRVDTLTLRGPNAFDGVTHQPYGLLDGRFRLDFGAQSCPGDGRCGMITDSLRVSNEFAIRTRG